MNTGIITSFVIGGILLLAILQFQTRIAKNSTEITLDVTSKNQIETLRRIISHDFNRIGFGENSKIKNVNPPHFINFSADVKWCRYLNRNLAL